MNLKEFASSRNMSQSKVRQLSKEVLGTVPASFTPEDIKKLDNALGGATVNFLESTQTYLEGGEEEIQQITSDLSLHEPEKLETTQRVKEIIGEELLKKNILLYLSFLKQSLEEDKYKLECAAFQVEQSYYNKLQHYQHSLYEDGKRRVRNARYCLTPLFTAEGIREEITKNEDPELGELLLEALSFIEDLG